MKTIVILFGILIFIILILLYCCIKVYSKAINLEFEIRVLEDKYCIKTKEYNTLALMYKATKEALETQEPTNAKH
jgi:hypothetical protein